MTCEHQLDQLRQFITRLSKVYEGIHPQIDAELQVLCDHLESQTNLALTEISIGKLTGMVMQHTGKVKKHNTYSLTFIDTLLKKVKAHSNDHMLLEQTNALLSQLNKKNQGLLNTLPHLETAVRLYQQALENAQAHQASTQNASSIQNANELHQSINQELTELINQLSYSHQQNKKLKDVQTQLHQGIDQHTLLECCLVIIRAILKDVVTQREYAESFIRSLHQSLHKVSGNIEQSLANTTAQYQRKIDASQAIKTQICALENAADNSDDLAKLKQQTSDCLQKMTASLASREEADKHEQSLLLRQLNELQAQINHLEQQTANYQARLLEQKQASHRDALTQLPNRQAYDERIGMEFRRWRRHKQPLCLALLDVDHFKSINDNYGHASGDKTLQVLAKSIRRCLRESDFLARWGGEEFVVIFADTDVNELSKPLETIRAHVEHLPFKFKDQRVPITLSIGASHFTENDDIASVFERADQALYEAKHSGRNRCIIRNV